MKLSLAELEALAVFLSERYLLWKTHTRIFGVEDADNLPRQIAQAHARKVQQTMGKPAHTQRTDLARR